MDHFAPVLILGIIFWGIVAIIREVAQQRLRRQIVDKGITPANVQALFPKEETGRFGSLKWGMLLLGVGLVMLAVQLVPEGVSDETTIGAMLVAAGASLLVFYAVVPKAEAKPEDRKPAR